MTIKVPVPRIPSRLLRLPDIGPHTVECSDDLRLLFIDKAIPIHFTPIEYRIIQRLLETPRALVDDAVLIRAAFLTEPCDQQQNLDRHIDELRRKLKWSGLTILRVVQRGWLLSESDESDAEPPAS